MKTKTKHFIGNVLLFIIPVACLIAACEKVIHDDGWVVLLEGIGLIIGIGIVICTLILGGLKLTDRLEDSE